MPQTVRHRAKLFLNLPQLCELLNIWWVCRLVCGLMFGVLAGPSEAESFQLEMSGLLSELACPYSVLVTGDITQRFLNKDDCLLLLSRTSFTRHLPSHNLSGSFI